MVKTCCFLFLQGTLRVQCREWWLRSMCLQTFFSDNSVNLLLRGDTRLQFRFITQICMIIYEYIITDIFVSLPKDCQAPLAAPRGCNIDYSNIEWTVFWWCLKLKTQLVPRVVLEERSWHHKYSSFILWGAGIYIFYFNLPIKLWDEILAGVQEGRSKETSKANIMLI